MTKNYNIMYKSSLVQFYCNPKNIWNCIYWEINMFRHLQNFIIFIIFIELQKLVHEVKINMHSHICTVFALVSAEQPS